MNDYLSSLGSPAQPVIPSDSSIILVDSRYRDSESHFNSPSDFIANLNTEVKAKYLFYQQLVWNQPVFTHNLTNNLLVYQICHPQDTHFEAPQTYAVFARPFYIYTSFDGNPSGSVYQTPIGPSYANQMEYALNVENRNIINLASLSLNPPLDYQNPAHTIYKGLPMYQEPGSTNMFQATAFFRYCSSRGFVMYFRDVIDPSIEIPFRIMNCPYIEHGHFIHGFGRFDNTQNKFIVPEDWLIDRGVYFAENPPLLLPDRFYYITSTELARNRRSQSTHNFKSLANFSLELAVIALNLSKSKIYHANSIQTEASSISLANNSTIQSFRISILDETGNIIQCGDPFGFTVNNGNNALEGNWDPTSFLDPTYGGTRGTAHMMNYLLFGAFGINWNPNWTYAIDPAISQIHVTPQSKAYYIRPDLIEPDYLLTIHSIPYPDIALPFKNYKLLDEDIIHVISAVLAVS